MTLDLELLYIIRLQFSRDYAESSFETVAPVDTIVRVFIICLGGLTARAFETRRAVRRGDGLKVPCYVFVISMLSAYFAVVTRVFDYFILHDSAAGIPGRGELFLPRIV